MDHTNVPKEQGNATDETLMLRAAADNLSAFEELVRRHQHRIYRMAYQMLGQEEDAWDVSQEIFVKVYKARASYVQTAKFTTWLYRIANNAVIDHIRKHRRTAHDMSLDDSLQEPESHNLSPLGNVVIGQQTDQLSSALMKLSERQRSMLLLKYYEGCSVQEIARLFECADGTVKATLFQALRNLRKHLARLGLTNAEVSG